MIKTMFLEALNKLYRNMSNIKTWVELVSWQFSNHCNTQALLSHV